MAQARVRSNEVVSLMPLAEGLAAARTTALLKARQLEIVRVVLRAGEGMREHRAPGEITVQCLEGCVEFSTPDKVHILGPADLLHLEAGVAHALSARTDASLLVTLCL